MDKSVTLTIIYGVLAASANWFGGWIVAVRHLGPKRLRYLIALGAGFMLAAVFLKIMPETLEQWESQSLIPMTWFLGGYLLIQIVEHTFAPHFHISDEVHGESLLHPHSATAGVGALMLHAVFDGVSIAAAALASVELGVLVFIAILLHKLPEGATVASMMLAAGREMKAARRASFWVGAASLLGVMMVLVFKNVAIYSRPLSAHVLPLSAGITLYVAASDLIPEVNEAEGGWKTSALIFIGVAMFYLTDSLLHSLAH